MQRKIPILFLCIFFLFTAGCGTTAKKPIAPQKPGTYNTGKTTPKAISSSDKRVMADSLTREAQMVKGVKTAGVVVDTAQTVPTKTTNPTQPMPKITTTGKRPGTNIPVNAGLVALVGITLDKTTAMGKSETAIKKEVRQRLMAKDGKISEVLVTTDPAMVKRIKDVAATQSGSRQPAGNTQKMSEIQRLLRQKQ